MRRSWLKKALVTASLVLVLVPGWARSYSPAAGRYVQPDPIGLIGGSNRFNYVSSNPLSYSDPLGLQQQWRPGRPLENQIFEGASGGGGSLGGGGAIPGMIGAGAGAWISTQSAGPVRSPDPMQSTGLPPGFWPADKGAAEWGRRSGMGQREGRGRFHGIKQGCGGRPTDNFGVDPATGEVIDADGESVGNLWDAKPK